MVLTSRPSAWTASIVHDLALCAVDVDGARAAIARVAADVRAGQPEVVAQEVDEQEARLDVRLVGLAVDGDGDVLGAHRLRSLLRVRECALGRPCGVALRVISAAIARLYSTGPRTSPPGSALRGGRRAGLRGTASSDGALPTRIASASVAANGVAATPVTPIPARSIVAVRRPAGRSTATPTVAKSPTLRSSFS